MFLVPIWGGPSGVYMFACVRYFWVHTTKKSLVIFCSNSGGGDSSRVFTWICYSCPQINRYILVLRCDANAHRRELDPRSTRRKKWSILKGFWPKFRVPWYINSLRRKIDGLFRCYRPVGRPPGPPYTYSLDKSSIIKYSTTSTITTKITNDFFCCCMKPKNSAHARTYTHQTDHPRREPKIDPKKEQTQKKAIY